MNTHGMIINTLYNTVSYGRRIIPGMEEPVPLSTMTNPVSSSERTQDTIEELHHTTPAVSHEERIDITKTWKNKATVCGDCEVPDGITAPVRVRVKDAPIGSQVCLEGSPIIKRLVIEPTISSVQEGQATVPLVVNTTGSPIKIKHGLKLRNCLSESCCKSLIVSNSLSCLDKEIRIWH